MGGFDGLELLSGFGTGEIVGCLSYMLRAMGSEWAMVDWIAW